ncbi:MAG: hypothetical protein ACLRW4_05525 [Ruminococcus sp.]
MIKLKMSIEDISEYQTGILPKNAVKIETPQSIEEMMKKAAPIAAVLCVLMFVTMLCKNSYEQDSCYFTCIYFDWFLPGVYLFGDTRVVTWDCLSEKRTGYDR